MKRALVLVLFGCARAQSTTPTDSPMPLPAITTSATAAASSSAAPAPDRCEDIRKRFNDTLATRTDACTKDADCACYGAVGGGCGGVTDAKTAKLLEPIEAEFHAEKCRYLVQCAAWACAPKCSNAKCTR